jgi:quinol monooxygenase YgiN
MICLGSAEITEGIDEKENSYRRYRMIYVVVKVRVNEGKVREYIDLFKSVAETVRNEKGCVEYKPAVDAPGAPPDSVDKNTVFILERWNSMEDLQAHLGTSHMEVYFEKQKDLVIDSEIRVLEEA